LLVMVETYVDQRNAPLGKHVVVVKRRAKRGIRALLLHAGIQSRLTAVGGSGVLDRPEVGRKFASLMVRAGDIADLTWRRYRPCHYSGKVHFLKSEKRDSKYPNDPANHWSAWTDDFVVETLPGDHFEVLATHSESLAAALTRCIKELPPLALMDTPPIEQKVPSRPSLTPTSARTP
jgi:hypothetical protein